MQSAILATAWLLEVLVQTESAHNDSTVNVFEKTLQSRASKSVVMPSAHAPPKCGRDPQSQNWFTQCSIYTQIVDLVL